MKATELLQKQHRDIEALLQRLRGAGQGDERAIRQELASMLVAHAAIEQESFYPALHDALPEEINEALEEHGLADVQLARLLSAKPGDETGAAKATVLSEVVLNHIRREESDILRAADRELPNEVLNELGERMAQRFRQIVDAGYNKLLQKALEEELPRTASRTAAKKTARRAPAARKTRKRAARATSTAKRATPRRAPAKRTTTQRSQRKPRKQAPRKAKQGRAASSRTTRSRA